MAGKEIIYALASIILGGVLGYFWSVSRPQDPIEMVAAIAIIAIALVYFSLNSMGKH